MKYLNKIRSLYEGVELYDANLEEYQLHAIDFLKKNPKAALFIDTGLGKTAISLRVIRDLVDEDKITKVLIIAPLKVANQTWPDEVLKWHFSAPIPTKLVRRKHMMDAVNAVGKMRRDTPLSDKDFKKIERKVQSKMKKTKKDNPYLSETEYLSIEKNMRNTVEKQYVEHLVKIEKLSESHRQLVAQEKTNPTIINIINQENVEWLVDSWGDKWPYDCIIFDESDAIKDATTKRWKALDSVKHLVKHFYQLTATPAAESHLGLFAQIKLLDGGKRLGRTMTDYLSRYFDVNPYNRKKTLKDGAEDEITKAISDITLVMKQEDYLKDVPPYIIENVLYKIPEESKKHYESMSKTGGIRLDSGKEIYADQAASVLQKMVQISAGFVYESEEKISDYGGIIPTRKTYHLHDARVECLKELMAKYPDDNFLIAYYHQGSLEKLQKAFPHAVKMDTKGQQKNAWNEGKIKILLMHPKSGAHGLNLQKGGRVVINYDVYPSYGQFYQFLRRLARRGQPASEVLVFNILAEATYDMVIQRSCWVDKKNKQEVFFDMLKQLKKRGFK